MLSGIKDKTVHLFDRKKDDGRQSSEVVSVDAFETKTFAEDELAKVDEVLNAGIQKATNEMNQTKQNVAIAAAEVNSKIDATMKLASDRMDQTVIETAMQRQHTAEVIDQRLRDTNKFLDKKMKETNQYVGDVRKELE